MKKITVLCLLPRHVVCCALILGLSVLCPLSSVRAGTNDYQSVFTGEEADRLLGVASNLPNTVLSAGLADIGFVNQVVSSSFTNAAYAPVNLSAYIGTNVARVTLQFKGLAATTVSLRPYGDTNTVDDTSMNSVAIAAGSTADMTVNTDTNGVVDVKATANTSMTLIAFIRRHVFE